jgi:hypothetical protein
MKKYIHTCPRYTAPAEREQADSAAGRLTAATARYTAPWSRYTTGGGADGDLGRRTLERGLRTGQMEGTGVTRESLELLLGHPSAFGLHGP